MSGIGGRSIAEAKRNLSFYEVCRWAAFRRKRGSLHTGMRVESGAAVVSAALFRGVKKANGGDFKPTDFMPHMEEPPISLEQAMETWK